jgi:tagatose 6-phosphate kinase
LRECWAIRERSGRSTELLQPGPILEPAQAQALCDALLRATQDASLVVLSGSLPPGCDDDLYAGLVERLQARGLRCLLDASGAALRHGTAARPYTLKPNRDELEELTGMHIATLEDGVDALAALRNAGIAAPLLSFGEAGALLASDHGTWHAHAPVAAPVHTIGSGDCLLAGFATALQRGQDDREALRLAVACGAANASREQSGYVPPGVAAQWLDRVELRTLVDHRPRS